MSFYDALLFSKGQRGERGYSAYEIAVQEGYEGTQEEWANSFLSPTGYYTKTETDNKLKKKAYFFNSVASMKNSNVQNGDYVVTEGYYEANDGGGAEYLIRTKTQDDVDDGGSIHFIGNTLVAELIVKDNTVNVKQFGAYGDGTHDDTNAIIKAINSLFYKIDFGSYNYVLKEEINLKNHYYFGNNATILINKDSERTRETMIRNELYFQDTLISNTIRIKGLNFKTIRRRNPYLIGFQNCTIKMEECNIQSNGGGLFDLYGNNSNSEIINSHFIINNSKQGLGTCFELRGFGQGITKNIHVAGCTFEQDVKEDETIWINAGSCSIQDVLFENCIINDKGNSSNTIWIGNSNTYIKNIKFSDNIINKSNLTNRLFTIGKTEESDNSLINCKNILVTDNIINISKESNTEQSYAVSYGVYDNENIDADELKFNNNIVNVNSEYSIDAVCEGKFISTNNKYNLNKVKSCYLHFSKAKNDIVVGNCNLISYSKNSEFDGLTVDILKNIVNDLGFANNNVVIKNSNLKCKYLLYISSNEVEGNYKIVNNIIVNTEEYLIANYSNATITVELAENNIENATGYIIGNSLVLRIANNYKKGVLKKGIPGYATDRNSCTVGTIFFSGTNGKTIVRKISEGNSVSNWEEL